MNIIKLNDNQASIIGIKFDPDFNVTTVDLYWGGLNDRFIYEFEIDLLGDVLSMGGNSVSGWVILNGSCKLLTGDVVQYKGDA